MSVNNLKKSIAICESLDDFSVIFDVNSCPHATFTMNEDEEWRILQEFIDVEFQKDDHQIAHPSQRFLIAFCDNKIDVVDFAYKNNLNLMLRNPIVTEQIESVTVDKNFNYVLLNHKGENNYQRVLYLEGY